MVRTQIQLTESQAARLKELAQAESTSMAELIRRGVELYLAAAQGSLTEDDRRRRALAVVGGFRSGVPDLAERHDDYLDEAYRG
jgi:hypothetical protein